MPDSWSGLLLYAKPRLILWHPALAHRAHMGGPEPPSSFLAAGRCREAAWWVTACVWAADDSMRLDRLRKWPPAAVQQLERVCLWLTGCDSSRWRPNTLAAASQIVLPLSCRCTLCVTAMQLEPSLQEQGHALQRSL